MLMRGGFLFLSSQQCFSGSSPLLDFLFLGLGLGFFAAACLYLFACDRL
jgi:hypothetical protein